MPFSDEMSALYPGESFGRNKVEIVNGKEVVMSQLEIAFLDDDRQAMAFPMVAGATANSSELYFDHLSAGVQITLSNPNDDINITRLTIVAQSNEEVGNLGIENTDTIARWAVEGPWVPLGLVGHNDDVIDVTYSSVMNFVLSDKVNNTEYKTLEGGGGELKFCIPLTISSMDRIKVIGYDDNGDIAFYVRKEFNQGAVEVKSNNMYTLPVIEIGRGTE